MVPLKQSLELVKSGTAGEGWLGRILERVEDHEDDEPEREHDERELKLEKPELIVQFLLLFNGYQYIKVT